MGEEKDVSSVVSLVIGLEIVEMEHQVVIEVDQVVIEVDQVVIEVETMVLTGHGWE